MNQLFQECLREARRRVEAKKAEYNHVEAYAFDVSVEGGSTSQAFSRSGTSSQQKEYQLPANLASLIESTYLNSGVPASLTSSQQTFLSQMLSLVPEAVAGLTNLAGTRDMSPTEFTGSSTLSGIADRDPFSDDWETNTQNQYDRAYGKAIAHTASGPDNVRGGQARAGFELAETNDQMSRNRFREVHDAQLKDSADVQSAIHTANAIEAARRGVSLAAQGQQENQQNALRQIKFGASDALNPLRANALASTAMGAEFTSRPKMTTTDDLSGKGNQSHFNYGGGVGIGCCFIMLAARGGELPWWVRKCRDVLGSDATRLGYRRMAKWLVPLMERYAIVRILVDAIMVHPLIEYGGYLCRVKGREAGFVFRPVKRFWFAVWNFLGK